jgi:hypothetical protein
MSQRSYNVSSPIGIAAMGKSSVSAEYLNLHWFHTIDDAKGKIKAWRTYPGPLKRLDFNFGKCR